MEEEKPTQDDEIEEQVPYISMKQMMELIEYLRDKVHHLEKSIYRLEMQNNQSSSLGYPYSGTASVGSAPYIHQGKIVATGGGLTSQNLSSAMTALQNHQDIQKKGNKIAFFNKPKAQKKGQMT